MVTTLSWPEVRGIFPDEETFIRGSDYRYIDLFRTSSLDSPDSYAFAAQEKIA